VNRAIRVVAFLGALLVAGPARSGVAGGLVVRHELA
jgi:hypothetical protein